jgi:alanine or glycine:cation symporter, AGCS family
MESFLDALFAANDVFWLWVLIPLLCLVSILYIVLTKGVQFRLLPQMFRTLREAPEVAPDGKKAISAFQAFAVSSSARVGTGNIVGVSIAIAIGGPGAVFWMWVMALVVAAAAFAESTLGQLYKVKTETGYRGGPAYYIKHGLGLPWLGAAFAVILIVTFPLTFNMVQANTFTGAISTSLGSAGIETGAATDIAIGVLLAAVVATVIFGGMRRIAHVTQTLIPTMATVYLIIGVFVIVLNIDAVPTVFADIVGSAFGLREVGGGAVGAAFLYGVRRGMFSNEAGMGSAPNAGASASVTHPVKQGLTQAFGVYFDTLFICSISAFIILLTNPVYGESGIQGDLVGRGLENALGPWALHLLTLIIVLFTFTSMLGNYYYGEANILFMSEKRAPLTVLRLAVVAAVFGGTTLSLGTVWDLADITMGVMAFVNLVAILMLAGVVYRLLADYDRQRGQGLDPVFTRDRVPGLRGVQVWESAEEVEDKAPSKLG